MNDQTRSPFGPSIDALGRVHELARSFYLPVTETHTYAVEIGYWSATGEWLPIARSHRVTSPPRL